MAEPVLAPGCTGLSKASQSNPETGLQRPLSRVQAERSPNSPSLFLQQVTTTRLSVTSSLAFWRTQTVRGILPRTREPDNRASRFRPRLARSSGRGLRVWATIPKRVFEKSRFCHISPTIFPHSSFQTAGRTLVRAVGLDLPGLFKHPLRRIISTPTAFLAANKFVGAATMPTARSHSPDCVPFL